MSTTPTTPPSTPAAPGAETPTPTPRCDAHFDYVKTLARATANVKAMLLYEKFIDGNPLENDVPVWMTLAYCEGGRFARQLERELTEAKAERDALKAQSPYGQLRETEQQLWIAEAKLEEANRIHEGDEKIRLRLVAERDRWRALAEELAGALEQARASFNLAHQSELNGCHDEVLLITGVSAPRITKALARYRDAANPASARTPPGTNERSGDE